MASSPQLDEPGGVVHFMRLVIAQARVVKPMAIKYLVIGKPELD
jgi:hypothetical protein